MLNILRIDASARSQRSLTRALADRFLDALLQARPEASVTRRDVGASPPPFLTETWTAAAFTAPDARSDDERAALALSDRLIAEVKAADLIVLSSPLYNYGMPGALKAWVDQVIRVGETFSFDLARGDYPIAPVLSGKRMVVLTSSGEFGFDQGGVRSGDDHLIPHLRTIGKYLGVGALDVIRIEYQEFGDARHQRSKDDAHRRAVELAHQIAGVSGDMRAPV